MVLPDLVKKIFLSPVLYIVILVLFSLIQPLKDVTDPPRATMNCPNTATFNQANWTNLSANDHTSYSTGCYILNWDMLLFVGGLVALAIYGWFK